MFKIYRNLSLPTIGIISVSVILIIFFIMIKIKANDIEEKRKTDFEKKENLVNVITITLKPSEIKESINLVAQTEAWADFNIPAEVSGIILRKNFEKGAYVRKGKIIAVIDSNRYKNALDSASASYELTSNIYERILKLYEKQSINKHEVDKAKASFETAKANLNNARLDLNKCSIKAPASGFIDSFFVEKGEFIGYGGPVARLIDYDKIKVVVNIPESEIANVKDINEFLLTIDALEGKTFRGKKYFLSKVPDNLAKVYRLEIEVDNKEKPIFPGMFARVEIIKKQSVNTVVIPITSITNTKNENFVFIENNGTAEKRIVELGIFQGSNVEITDGISFGEKLIAVRQGDFEDNQKVKVIKNIERLSELEKIRH